MPEWGYEWGGAWGDTPGAINVAAIHQAQRNNGAWLLVIEGCPIGWTDNRELAGTAYLGTDYGAREVLLGLSVPDLPLGETVPLGAEIKEARVSFRLTDFDGRVAALFAETFPDGATDSMGARLAPTQNPAPETTPGPAQTPVQLWGRHVGIEAIGPAGERRHFWVEPTTAPPGLDHFAGAGWPPSVITDDPYVWEGRTAALYRIVQDPATGEWPDWESQHAGGSLWWVGRLKGRGTFSSGNAGRVFSLPCTGVNSLIKRGLNLSRPSAWVRPADVSLGLTGDELLFACWIGQNAPLLDDGIDTNPSTFDCRPLTATGNNFSGCVTREDFADRMRDIIDTMINGVDTGSITAASNAGYVGPNPPADQSYWRFDATNGPKRQIVIAPDASTISIKCEPDSGAFDGFFLGICLDLRIAQYLGWDVASPEWSTTTSNTRIGGPSWGGNAGDEIAPDFHVIGRFNTRVGNDDENFGTPVVYEAPYPEGTITLRPQGGETINLGVGSFDCEGQLGQPYTLGAQIDSVDIDSAGWWLVRGQRLTAKMWENGDDPEDYVQVALCEWVATTTGDGVAEDSLAYARLVVKRWEDPRRFGLPYDRMAEPWTAVNGGLEVAPIAVFGGISGGAPGWRHRLIPSLLLSSGTASFVEVDGEVTVSPGENHPSDVPNGDPWPGDVEVADLGLGLPASWVDWASWYACAAALPGGSSGALNRVLYASLGPIQAETVLRQAMGGVGWAWSYKRDGGLGPARLGCWDPVQPLAPGDVEVTITRGISAETSSPAQARSTQWQAVVELRSDGPFDRFAFRTDGQLLEDGLAYERTHESQDPGRRYRDGAIVWSVEDAGLRDPTPWLGTQVEALYAWDQAARERFAAGLGIRFARSRRVYRDILDARYITRLGLGSIVHVVNPTVESPDGVIGVNHLGRVIDATIVTGDMQGIRVAVLLEPRPIDAIKVWGPCATAGVGSWDADTSTLTISSDYAGVGETFDDLTGFTQPAWDSREAGQLRVAIYQSEDAVDYPSGLEARASVVSVDVDAGTITLGSIVGTIYRDMVKRIVAAPYDEQTAAWALGLLMPVTDPSGEFDGEKGFRL